MFFYIGNYYYEGIHHKGRHAATCRELFFTKEIIVMRAHTIKVVTQLANENLCGKLLCYEIIIYIGIFYYLAAMERAVLRMVTCSALCIGNYFLHRKLLLPCSDGEGRVEYGELLSVVHR